MNKLTAANFSFALQQQQQDTIADEAKPTPTMVTVKVPPRSGAKDHTLQLSPPRSATAGNAKRREATAPPATDNVLSRSPELLLSPDAAIDRCVCS